MDIVKQPIKGNATSFFRRYHKIIIKIIAIIILLSLTVILSYNAGVKKASSKTKSSFVMPTLEKLKTASKKKSNNAKDSSSKQTAITTNSGFFRLAGSVTSNKSKTIGIKLTNGTIITLAVADNANYYTSAPRAVKPVSQLKLGSTVQVIGTIGVDGAFNTSNLQAIK